jgi:hypothetical protein
LIDALFDADGTARAKRASAERADAAPVSPSSETTSIKSLAAKTDTDSPRPHAENVKTQVLGAGEDDKAPAAEDLAPPGEPIEDLPPLDVRETPAALSPTLFLGVGGTAARVLVRLRRRLEDRFGAAPIPSIRMLLVDTDVKSLLAASSPESETRLGEDETMPLGLRSAREYTANSRNMMQWLSRRWLYNIPRSLLTEGRRPLGRLALVDHAPQLVERLRALVTELVREESIRASAERTGTAFSAGPPRVFIVASVSGGTGGGMALDLAYAVRQILGDLGCAAERVCEVLAHSTDRNPAAAELATANAYATLAELEHYSRFGYSPDGPASGLPQVAGGRRALAHPYFVHLGDGLNEREFAAATDILASYLYLNTVTSAAGLFDECRRLAGDSGDATPLASFSLASVGCSHTSLPPLAAEYLVREILDHWRGTSARKAAARSSLVDIATRRDAAEAPQPANEMARRAAEHAAGLELSVEPLRERAAQLVTRELGGDAEAIFARLRAVVEGHKGPPAARTRRLLEAIGNLFDANAVAEGAAASPAAQLHAAVESAVKPIAEPKGQAIGQWILEFVNDPAVRIAGALQAKDWYAAHLRNLEGECARLVKDTQHNLQALARTLIESEKNATGHTRIFGARQAEKKHRDQVDSVLVLMVGLRIAECALYGAIRLVRLIAASVAAAGDRLKDVQHEIGQLARRFDAPAPWNEDETAASPGATADPVRGAAARRLREAMSEMAERVDARFQADFLLPHGGLLAVCEKSDALRKCVADSLRALARAEVLAALKQTATLESAWGDGLTADERRSRLAASLEAARGRFTDCGGAQRLLAIVPASSKGLEDAVRGMTPPATVVVDSDPELVLCYEQERLSLAHVASRLVDGRSDIIQIAGRLHTRMDVPWSKLPQIGPRPAPECACR